MTSSIILDLSLLIVMGFTIFISIHRGFISTIFNLASTGIALVVDYMIARALTPQIFEKFLKEGLVEKVAGTIVSEGTVTLEGIIGKLGAFLPENVVDGLTHNLNAFQSVGGQEATKTAAMIVDNVIAPLLLPVISIIIFFVVYAVISVVLRFVGAALMNMNKLPLFGRFNKIFGGVAGVALGILYVILILCAVWAVVYITGDRYSALNTATLEGSQFYAIFESYNPFI